MTAQCPDLLELDLILALPESDPLRQHLDTCPRCRGRVEALELFLDPGDTSDLAGLEVADRELAGRLDQLATGPRRTGVRRARRFGLAVAAALALVAVGITTSELLRTNSIDAVSTGQYQRGPARAEGVVVRTTSGGIEVAWPAAPAADEIVYLFFSEDMRELGRRNAAGSLMIEGEDPLSSAAFCQAIAVDRGDEIARSAISRLLDEPE